MTHDTRIDLSERDAWLVALRTPGLGNLRIAKLYEHFGSLRAALDASRGALRAAGMPAAICAELARSGRGLIRADLDWLDAAPHRHVLTLADPDYPPLLRRLDDAPPLLFVEGDLNALWRAQIAMVGSRNASRSGLGIARDFAKHFARLGIVVTSGLAEGIDGSAHTACLDAGGATIAVCGTGLDRVYPERHRDLARRIVAQGALVSDFPIGTPPLPEHFPRRNRIIAGLTLGTLVVEASLKSGSLITARLAAECGRDVFAIPGSIHDPRARGCHHLIRNGATLVTEASEIIEALQPIGHELGDALRARLSVQAMHMPAIPAADAQELRLLDAIGFAPTDFDSLVTATGMSAAAISSMLMTLELDGQVAEVGGSRYQRLAR
ncbi:MAG: DNA-processing protein DprA [Xanthomonadales bacterium]|nr:DNA-processing protein DprA [Xanthomonadales bacterium]MBP7622971.1 DNA-processing protein DprA [Xanthomonadales bacterium]